MSADDTPLDHLPDPSKRFQVLAILRRDTDVDIEIVDVVTKQGIVVPLFQALEIAADINLEAARIMRLIADQMTDGTLPAFERRKVEWGPHGEGTAEQN